MDNYLFNPQYHRLADFMGIDKFEREDYETATKLLKLYEWGLAKTDGEFTSILKEVTKMKRDLGLTLRGNDLVKEMYKWVRLDEDSKRLDNEKKAYKDKMTEKERKAAELQERIIDRKKKWDEKKESLEKQRVETEGMLVDKMASQLKSAEKKSKELSKANIEAKEGKGLEKPKEV